MASTAATGSPTSLQLRYAFKCRNCRGSGTLLACARFRKFHPRSRMLSVARTGNAGSSIRSESAADAFSGWSDSDDVERPIESQRKQWFGGIVGAGVAGVVLVAGLTFAALSLSNKNTPRPKQQMEPLTTQQEVSLISDNLTDAVKENENLEEHIKEGDSCLESEPGTNEALSSSSEFIDASTENKLVKDNGTCPDNIESKFKESDITDAASIQECLQNKSAIDDMLVGADASPSSTNMPVSGNVSSSFAASSLNQSDSTLDNRSSEPTSEIEKNLVNVIESNSSNPTSLCNDHHDDFPTSEGYENSNLTPFSDSSVASSEPLVVNSSVRTELNTVLEPQVVPGDNLETVVLSSYKENLEISKTPQVLVERNSSPMELNYLSESESSRTTSMSVAASPFLDEQDKKGHSEMKKSKSFVESQTPGTSFSPPGIPAPSVVSAALQVLPGRVLVPAVVDQVQGQALAALQVLKVIEADAQPSDLCTRREYARWLVSASSALSRNTLSKVYPAMYIENVTELAFDDITPDDPDFSSIQGLAEAGLISSKLSNRDLLNEHQGPFYFSPESPLSHQDLVSWKMALEKRQLPEANRKILYELSGFIDIDKINPTAWPALVADLSSGEQGIIALAFGCTRLFQPDKPVTKAQAAVALATGEASDIVSEELARIEAESMAENAVTAHSALVAEVEKDINASFEEELLKEKEKIDAVEKMAEEAQQELERLRAQREEDKAALMKERAATESEMEVLSRLRHEVEEQLESLMSNKIEISYEKERISKLRKETENENQEIARLQYELEVERKALSMARAWAEDEAKRAREQAKALEEARDRWERHGIKVVVDSDLQEHSAPAVTWLNAGKQFSVDGTVSRAQTLVDKLKVIASDVEGKSREFINKIVQKILYLISVLKEWASRAGANAIELKDKAVLKARGSVQGLQQSTAEFSLTFREGAKRVAGDCREGVEKLTQKFKT